MLARQNNIEEVSPWAIIRIIVPIMLHGDWIKVAEITNPMWPTDE